MIVKYHRISRVLINSNISHDEFFLVNNLPREKDDKSAYRNSAVLLFKF